LVLRTTGDRGLKSSSFGSHLASMMRSFILLTSHFELKFSWESVGFGEIHVMTNTLGAQQLRSRATI
jgi:hypothetical protein